MLLGMCRKPSHLHDRLHADFADTDQERESYNVIKDESSCSPFNFGPENRPETAPDQLPAQAISSHPKVTQKSPNSEIC